MSGFCERAGTWAAGLTAADLPQTVADRARLQLVSIRAAAAAGENAARPFRAVAAEGPLGRLLAEPHQTSTTTGSTIGLRRSLS